MLVSIFDVDVAAIEGYWKAPAILDLMPAFADAADRAIDENAGDIGNHVVGHSYSREIIEIGGRSVASTAIDDATIEQENGVAILRFTDAVRIMREGLRVDLNFRARDRNAQSASADDDLRYSSALPHLASVSLGHNVLGIKAQFQTKGRQAR